MSKSTNQKNSMAILIKDIVKRNALIGVVIFVFVLLFKGLSVFIVFKRSNDPVLLLQAFNGVDSRFVLIVIGLFILCAGAVLLNPLHHKEESFFLHALPLTRTQIFIAHYIAGFILTLLPIVVMTAILLPLQQGGVGNSEYIKGVIEFSRTWVFLTISTMSITFLSGMLTGNRIIHVFVGMVISVIMPSLSIALGFFSNVFLHGHLSFETRSVLFNFSPFSYIAIHQNFSTTAMVVISVTFVIFSIIAYVLYKKYPLEKVQDSVSFRGLKYIYLVLLSFCGLVIGGLVSIIIISRSTQGIPSENKVLLYVGFLLGLSLFYLIGFKLVNKGKSIKKSLKGLCVAVLLSALLVGVFKIDVTGFEKRVPLIQDVNQVQVIFNGGEEIAFKETNSKKVVMDMHKFLIEHGKSSDLAMDESWVSVEIVYKKKDGGTLEREYYFDQVSAHEPVSKVFQLKELKSNHFKFLSQLTVENRDAPFLRYATTDKVFQIEEVDQAEFIDVVKADYEKLTPAQLEENILNAVPMELSFMGVQASDEYEDLMADSPTYKVSKHNEVLVSWLMEKGYISDLFDTQNIEFVSIKTVLEKEIDNMHAYNLQQSEVENFWRTGKLPKEGKGERIITEASQLKNFFDFYYSSKATHGKATGQYYLITIVTKENDFNTQFLEKTLDNKVIIESFR